MICGNPSLGPWVAWKAMKNVPITSPKADPSTAHPMLRPNAGPVNPRAMVKKLQLAMKNSGLTRHGVPCRSAGVIQSMDRLSTAG